VVWGHSISPLLISLLLWQQNTFIFAVVIAVFVVVWLGQFQV